MRLPGCTGSLITFRYLFNGKWFPCQGIVIVAPKEVYPGLAVGKQCCSRTENQ